MTKSNDVMQVFLPDGKLIFSSNDKDLFYPQEICRSMRENGYKVLVNGKLYPQLRKRKEINEDG